MFYVLVFSILAVILVVGGIAGINRRRGTVDRDNVSSAHHDADRRKEKAKRAQSQHDRRKRH
jgi:hypothetical protein